MKPISGTIGLDNVMFHLNTSTANMPTTWSEVVERSRQLKASKAPSWSEHNDHKQVVLKNFWSINMVPGLNKTNMLNNAALRANTTTNPTTIYTYRS